MKQTKHLWKLLLFSLLLLLPSTVLAHTRVEIGPYVVVVGWLHEPPIVGERNSLVFEISAEDQPVTDAAASLNIQVLYGGRSFTSSLVPTETPGLYTAELLPTVRGQYEVRLTGKLGDTEVDQVIQPEEVFPASRLEFPEALPDTIEMQQQLDDMQSQLQSARILALTGMGLGVLGLVLGVVGVVRRRS